jgi:hypothetical protein
MDTKDNRLHKLIEFMLIPDPVTKNTVYLWKIEDLRPAIKNSTIYSIHSLCDILVKDGIVQMKLDKTAVFMENENLLAARKARDSKKYVETSEFWKFSNKNFVTLAAEIATVAVFILAIIVFKQDKKVDRLNEENAELIKQNNKLTGKVDSLKSVLTKTKIDSIRVTK